MQERKPLKENVSAEKPTRFNADILKSKKRALSNEEQHRLNDMLWDAAAKGKTKRAERLLKAGANVETKDPHGQTALMYAALHGHTQTCALLLEKGADIRPHYSIRNALHKAADGGHTGTCAFLIGKGANLWEQDAFGKTAHDLATGKTKQFLKSVPIFQNMVVKEEFSSFMISFGECLSS
jgi:ankyrin repeat protein